MADATRFSVMSKQIEDNKQATDDLRAQMADLAKSQADACKSVSHMEAMLSMFVSQNGAQTNRTPILNSPSGCLTASTTLNRMLAELKAMTANREATMSKFLSQTSIQHRPPFPPPEPPDLAKLFESPLLHTPAIHPRAPFRPNQNQNNQGLTDEIVFDKDNDVWLLNGVVTQQSKIEFEVESIETGSSIQQIELSGVKDVMSTTHKADSVSGEETITSNASESSQVSSQVSPYYLPIFDGTLPDCWIVEVDRFFELKKYGNEEKLDLISLSLEGAALKWFRRHRREFTDWTDVKRKLMARFGLVKDYSPPEVLPKEKFTKGDQDTDFGSEKESTNSVEITSIKGHEVQGTTASHVRQFDVTTIADAIGIAKCCESSLLQHSSATQSRAPFNPYQNRNNQCHYKREFGNYTGHEIEFDRECEEIEDDELKDKQPEEDVETLVMSENEQSLESVDDESFNDEKSGEIIAEGTASELVDKSGYKVCREGYLNSLLLQEFHIVLLHFKESSDTIVPCRNLDTRVLSSHFFAGGVKLLSKMVCAFLLPFLTMNIDSKTICLNSRSIFVDDDAVALRRIVEDRFVPRMEEIYLESTKQNLEFATDRGWVELWINTQDFTLTNYGLRLSPSEYTKNTFLLVYHLSRHSASCLFLNTSTGCIGALLMIYDAKMLIQLDAPTVFNDLLCKMRIVHGLEDLRQFTRAGIKFHLKHKWRSKFGSNKPTRTWTSYNRYDSSSCVLRQEKNYVMALFPIGEALTLVNDQHTLVAQKKGTETSTGCCYGFHADLDLMADVTTGTADISMDEFSSVCKLLFGVFVLNLIADQVRDWSFFGLLLQWKWHPPPQATSEFHQAHNDKPVFHL